MSLIKRFASIAFFLSMFCAPLMADPTSVGKNTILKSMDKSLEKLKVITREAHLRYRASKQNGDTNIENVTEEKTGVGSHESMDRYDEENFSSLSNDELAAKIESKKFLKKNDRQELIILFTDFATKLKKNHEQKQKKHTETLSQNLLWLPGITGLSLMWHGYTLPETIFLSASCLIAGKGAVFLNGWWRKQCFIDDLEATTNEFFSDASMRSIEHILYYIDELEREGSLTNELLGLKNIIEKIREFQSEKTIALVRLEFMKSNG